MELISRGRLLRHASVQELERLPRDERSVKLSIGAAPRGFRPAPHIGARIGCDPMEAARQAAAANNPGPNMQAGNIYGAPQEGLSPVNCKDAGLRYVPIGAAFGAVGAATATTATISPQAPFLPYAIAFSPVANAGNVQVTGIKYGTVEELIGGVLNGELFIPTAFQQGYRLQARAWVVPGQTIVISATTIAALAANALTAMVYGFTNAPG